MKVISRYNLKRREAVAVKGVGKSSLVFRAGNTRYGYTNSRERGHDYQPEGYGNLDAASPETLLTIENFENEVESLRHERDEIEDKIRVRQTQLRELAKSLPPVDINALPKLEPIKETRTMAVTRAEIDERNKRWQEIRDSGANYIPYGCTLFVLPNSEEKGEAA